MYNIYYNRLYLNENNIKEILQELDKLKEGYLTLNDKEKFLRKFSRRLAALLEQRKLYKELCKRDNPISYHKHYDTGIQEEDDVNQIKESAKKGYLEFLNNREEKDIRDGFRDIMMRCERNTAEGGYPVDTIIDFLYVYFYEIVVNFRNDYGQALKEKDERIKELEEELRRK
jgi:hypothetical protein